LNRPLLLGGALILAGLGTAGALYVAPLGGEEEAAPEVQETASATPSEPEGWLRFSHPGTAEAPPFSFAYPGEWYVKEPEEFWFEPVSGEPPGMAVRVEVFSWDPGSLTPSPNPLPNQSPRPPIPDDSMRLSVFVGPFAPWTHCGPDDAGVSEELGGFPARRLESLTAPSKTWDAIVVYAITPDDCYALDARFSREGPYEAIFNQIVESFRVGDEAASAPPQPTLVPTSESWETYTDPQLGFSFPHPPGLTLKETTFEEHATDSCPAVQARIVSLVDEDGVGKTGVVVAPNPCNFSLEEWIRTFPGWPCEPNPSPTCEPEEVTVSGEPGIRFSLDSLGEPAATIYFAHGDVVYALGGNVYGSGEARTSPTLAEEDFQRIVAGFRFAAE
jgi:hypothetical protein